MDNITRNKKVKERLAKLFGLHHVSVRNGKGTACGWCDIYIDILRPKNCTCVKNATYCDICKKKLNLTHDIAESAIRGIEFYKYTDDMGFDHHERSIQISFTE